MRGSTDTEQVPTVTKQTVIRKIGHPCTDRGHGDVVHNKHHDSENRECQPTVGDNFINLIGGRELALPLSFITIFNNRADIGVALVGDDGFRIVIQLFFHRRNITANVL